MSEQNKAIVQRWYNEVWNEGNESTLHELFRPESQAFGFPEPGAVITGPEAFLPLFRSFRSAFSDLRITIDEMVSEGDTVAMRWTATSVHTGDALGFPASGKHATLEGSTFFHFRDGKILNAHNYMDFTRLALQLQAPSPSGS